MKATNQMTPNIQDINRLSNDSITEKADGSHFLFNPIMNDDRSVKIPNILTLTIVSKSVIVDQIQKDQ